MTPDELAWKWMNHDSNFYELSEIVHDGIEGGLNARAIGRNIERYFYEQTPFFGEDSFWVELLDGCMEKVSWTKLAGRAIWETAVTEVPDAEPGAGMSKP